MRVFWINGAFGVGKTTTAAYLLEKVDGWRYFDPETVGYLIRNSLSDFPSTDFQEFSAWRKLVPRFLVEIGRETSHDIVAVQTVLNNDYWDEIRTGLINEKVDVVHVVLDCEEEVLRERIRADQHDLSAMSWRLGHVDVYKSARPWLEERADAIVDTTRLSPVEVAGQLVELLDL